MPDVTLLRHVFLGVFNRLIGLFDLTLFPASRQFSGGASAPRSDMRLSREALYA